MPYGLAAHAWCQATPARVAVEAETGMLGINTTMIGGADAPFGGVKWSGHGHEDGPGRADGLPGDQDRTSKPTTSCAQSP
jgi:acyl-CoA reductase-like NAD-dependent aldehyde dehydrogenase